MINDTWTLTARSENHLYLNLTEDKQNYKHFEGQFLGDPMGYNWQAPKIEIEKKRKRLLDFVSFELGAPVISEKAKAVLEPIISQYVEILPLIEIRGEYYSAINVTCIADCIDIENCEVSRDEDGSVINIYSYAFYTEHIPEVPIFKTPGHWGSVFVRQSFVDAVIKGNLRGAVFSDPGVSPFVAIMAGEIGNVVPGLPE